MTKLSDTQTIILSAAAQRPNRLAIPLPDRLKGGAAQKVVASMLARGLLARVPAASMPAFGAQAEDGSWTTLVATDAGLDAIGIEPEAGPEAAVPYALNAGTNSAGEPAAGAPTGADETPVETPAKRRGRPRKAAPTGADVAPARKTREGTKQAQLIAMLRRKQGATIAQIVEVTAWRSHTVRGFFAGALKKKLGLAVTSEKIGNERIYRLPSA